MEELIQVIAVKPYSAPAPLRIENTLQAFQDFVGGYIETITIADDLCIVCNEDGRLMNLPPNCTICGVAFVGNIMIVKTDGAEFTDMTDEEAESFLDIWRWSR